MRSAATITAMPWPEPLRALGCHGHRDHGIVLARIALSAGHYPVCDRAGHRIAGSEPANVPLPDCAYLVTMLNARMNLLFCSEGFIGMTRCLCVPKTLSGFLR